MSVIGAGSWHHLVTEAFVFVARLIFSASVQIPPSTRMGGVSEIQLTNLKYAPFAENLDQQYLAVFRQKGSKITRAVVNQAVHMCFGVILAHVGVRWASKSLRINCYV